MSDSPPSLILYGVPFSQPVRAVLWLLLMKRMPFELVLTNPGSKGDNGSRELLEYVAPPGIRGELANLARSLDVPVFAAGLCADEQPRELENAGLTPLSSDPLQSSRIVEDVYS